MHTYKSKVRSVSSLPWTPLKGQRFISQGIWEVAKHDQLHTQLLL